MKRMMQTLLVAGTVAVMGVSTLASTAFADAIGYVDFEKLMGEYDRAQSFMADAKVREAELRKLQADYVKQIEETRKNAPKNPVASNTLEKQLNDQLGVKVQEYRDWSTSQQKSIDDSLQAAVKDAAKTRQINVVLARQAVFEGGVDITSDVLTRLNTTASATMPVKTTMPVKK
ncbi:MAG: OmpH family outer membrane protein [Vampirovibrionales bacterium]|nr:OmpH family outer membrane protein [Vampirovibrionales bacterium]